ncbi:MAG: hypothetical protein JSS86_04450 [Cyanobacteria bacterium SZAS LIN-2]|nr:hypothetical protein [Cyanobacteria bacterium SZAS LIN-2]
MAGPSNHHNLAKRTTHHQEYQTITAESWWCDKCLAQCSARAQSRSQVPEEHWSDFWLWLGRLLVKGYAAALAAAFGLIVFFIYDDDRPPELPTDQDTVWKWETQLKWLTLRRQRILLGLERDRGDMTRAYMAGDEDQCLRLTIRSEDRQRDLSQTQYKLRALEEKLSLHYRLVAQNFPQPNPEFYMAGQTGQGSQYQS